jgi:hypothetical protein
MDLSDMEDLHGKYYQFLQGFGLRLTELRNFVTEEVRRLEKDYPELKKKYNKQTQFLKGGNNGR